MMKRSGSANFNLRRLAGFIGGIFVVSALYMLIHTGIDYQKGPKVYQTLGQAAVVDVGGGGSGGIGGESAGNSVQTGAESDCRSVEIDFTYLKGINEDIIGWLLFDHNGISYPLLQGKDNQEYLYTLADRTPNDAGSIFMESLCSPDFKDPHTILYGHNRKDGTMFGKLKWYGADPDYYKENRFFTVYTPEGYFRYEVFAWYEAAQDDIAYQVGFAADEVFAEFVEKLWQRRSTDTKAAIGREDKIITLSTCSVAGRRFVVHGKMIGGE